MASTTLTAELGATVEYIKDLIDWSPSAIIAEVEGYPIRHKGAETSWRGLREAVTVGRDNFIRGFFGVPLHPEV